MSDFVRLWTRCRCYLQKLSDISFGELATVSLVVNDIVTDYQRITITFINYWMKSVAALYCNSLSAVVIRSFYLLSLLQIYEK